MDNEGMVYKAGFDDAMRAARIAWQQIETVQDHLDGIWTDDYGMYWPYRADYLFEKNETGPVENRALWATLENARLILTGEATA